MVKGLATPQPSSSGLSRGPLGPLHDRCNGPTARVAERGVLGTRPRMTGFGVVTISHEHTEG